MEKTLDDKKKEAYQFGKESMKFLKNPWFNSKEGTDEETIARFYVDGCVSGIIESRNG